VLAGFPESQMDNEKERCAWAESNELLRRYHDEEWGVPAHDDQHLFEMLNLEGAQAGLNWLTILKKRTSYRKAFDKFNAQAIARYSSSKTKALMRDDGIVRNRLKINAVIENAKAFLAVQKEFRTFDDYIWSFVNGATADRQRAATASQEMSKDLRKRGFRFVGPTICYAFMQAVGMVNDHSKECFRFRDVEKMGRVRRRDSRA
jgi:DNA-3-methyladenine glycosylase I